jgi:Protein of unknown function (DUF3052)
MAVAATAGYSGKPLWQKLGLKDRQRFYVFDAPPDLPQLLSGAPKGVARIPRLTEFDIALLFVKSRKSLAEKLAQALPKLADGGMIWVAWPKKTSAVVTDLTENTLRDLALPFGMVDVKVCAIDATWSGLKLLRRRATGS